MRRSDRGPGAGAPPPSPEVHILISHRHRFVVLLPWKCASTTLESRLTSDSPYSRFHAFNPHVKRVLHKHLVYADFLALPEARLGYFTAAFVRNPYDRVVSGFQQLQRDIETQPGMAFPDPGVERLVNTQLQENLASLTAAAFALEPWLEQLDDHLVRDVGRNTSFPLHPAHYWTHHAGVQAVDFIGRVENFEADFARFCDHVGVQATSRANANVTDPALVTQDGSYRYATQLSPSARARINTLFEADFALLDYRSLR